MQSFKMLLDVFEKKSVQAKFDIQSTKAKHFDQSATCERVLLSRYLKHLLSPFLIPNVVNHLRRVWWLEDMT